MKGFLFLAVLAVMQIGVGAAGGGVVDGSYILLLKEGSDPQAVESLKRDLTNAQAAGSGQLDEIKIGAGYHAINVKGMSADKMATIEQSHGGVLESVEQDQVVTIDDPVVEDDDQPM